MVGLGWTLPIPGGGLVELALKTLAAQDPPLSDPGGQGSGRG